MNRLSEAVLRTYRSLPSRCSCPRAPFVGPAAAKAAASRVAKLTFLEWWYMKGTRQLSANTLGGRNV